MVPMSSNLHKPPPQHSPTMAESSKATENMTPASPNTESSNTSQHCGLDPQKPSKGSSDNHADSKLAALAPSGSIDFSKFISLHLSQLLQQAPVETKVDFLEACAKELGIELGNLSTRRFDMQGPNPDNSSQRPGEASQSHPKEQPQPPVAQMPHFGVAGRGSSIKTSTSKDEESALICELILELPISITSLDGVSASVLQNRMDEARSIAEDNKQHRNQACAAESTHAPGLETKTRERPEGRNPAESVDGVETAESKEVARWTSKFVNDPVTSTLLVSSPELVDKTSATRIEELAGVAMQSILTQTFMGVRARLAAVIDGKVPGLVLPMAPSVAQTVIGQLDELLDKFYEDDSSDRDGASQSVSGEKKTDGEMPSPEKDIPTAPSSSTSKTGPDTRLPDPNLEQRTQETEKSLNDAISRMSQLDGMLVRELERRHDRLEALVAASSTPQKNAERIESSFEDSSDTLTPTVPTTPFGNSPTLTS